MFFCSRLRVPKRFTSTLYDISKLAARCSPSFDMEIHVQRSERMDLPQDQCEAMELVYIWETKGTPLAWRDAMRRSLRVISSKYVNEQHKTRTQRILRFDVYFLLHEQFCFQCHQLSMSFPK